MIDGPEIAGQAWTVDRAYQFCERLARSHYENFPVGSRLVPKRLRNHFYSIYSFARLADDFADEDYDKDRSDDERVAFLTQWRAMLKQSVEGRATHPVFIALAETIKQFDLPVMLFEDLLSAFLQDVTVRRYQSFDQLKDYCRRSANPVGRLILLLFGYESERLARWSDSICTALQLANHWQDVSIDLGKDRIYIPAEDLARFNLGEDDLKQHSFDERFRRLMEFEVERARSLLEEGKPLCVAVKGRLGLELRAIWLAGARILDRLEENRYDVFRQRPVITAADKVQIMLKAFRKGAFRTG